MAELRRNLAEHRRLAAERQTSRHEGEGRVFDAKTGAVIAFTALAVAVLGIVAAIASDAATLRILCAGLAAAGCALFTLVLLARRRLLVTAPTHLSETEAAYAQVVAHVAELATSLGLQRMPSDSDLETAAEKIDAAQRREWSLEVERRRTMDALERRKLARESLERAGDEFVAEQARFESWKVTHALGATLSPDGVLESLAALQTAWSHLGALDRVNARIGQLNGEVAQFATRLADLTGQFRDLGGRLESLESDPAGTLEELSALVEETHQLRVTRASLMSVVEDTSATLERSLGLGPDARRLRTELETGELLAWNAELEALGQEAGTRAELWKSW